MLVLIKPLANLAADELPRSHQIFGALCWGLRAVFGQAELEAMLARIDAGDPPLVPSSGLPWSRAGRECLLFLPRPVPADLPTPAGRVSLGLFRRLTRESGPGTFRPEITLAGDKAVLRDELPSPEARARAADTPRSITARRRSTAGSRAGEGTVHARTELAFPRDSGWWFLVQVRDPEWGPKLQAAVRWVCDTGWGADRSIGRGAAEAEFTDDPPGLSVAAAATRRLLLSAYHPTPAEREFLAGAAGSAYGLEYIRGRPSTVGPLLMVREGSVLPTPAGVEVAGACPTVSPEGAPLRLRCCGLAYAVPYGDAG